MTYFDAVQIKLKSHYRFPLRNIQNVILCSSKPVTIMQHHPLQESLSAIKMTEIIFEKKTKTAISFILMSVTWTIKQTVFWIKMIRQHCKLELPINITGQCFIIATMRRPEAPQGWMSWHFSSRVTDIRFHKRVSLLSNAAALTPN